MVLAHLPVLLKMYGLTDIQIGLAIGLFALASMTLMLPMGVLSDIFSPKRTILSGSLLFIIYFALLMVARTPALLLIVIIIGGIGTAALVVVTEALYLKMFGQEQRGKRIALYQLCTYLGFGLGPLTGGIIVQHQPQMLFTAALAGSLLLLVMCLFLADHEITPFSFKMYGRDLHRFKPVLLMACIFVIGTHFGVEQTSISLLMKDTLHFSSRQIGYLFAGLGLWMAAIVPFIGRLHDKRTSVFRFLLLGLGISAVFQITTSWASGFWSLLSIRLLHTFGDAIALLELSVLVALFFPQHRLGGNSGLLYAIRTFATFMAAFASGVVNKEWGYAASFLSNGIFVLLFVITAFTYIMTNQRRRQEAGWE